MVLLNIDVHEEFVPTHFKQIIKYPNANFMNEQIMDKKYVEFL